MTSETQQNLLNLFDRQVRIDVTIPGARKEVIGSIVRFLRPAPGMNFIAYSRIDPNSTDAEIAAQVEALRPLHQPFEWLVYDHDHPRDLGTRLEVYGFHREESSPILLLDLEDVPAELLRPAADFLPSGAALRQITERQGLEAVIQVMQDVYSGDFSWMRQRMGDHLEVPGYLSIYIAEVEGAPASTGWIYFIPNAIFAGLWGGATISGQRGRGLYMAILAARVQEARRRSTRYLYVDASAMSQPILRRYRFKELTNLCSYEWQG